MMMQKRWICLGLLLLTLGSLGHVCLCGFVNFDDPTYLTANDRVLDGLTWENLLWAFGESAYAVGFRIPLTWLSLQLDATLFGLENLWGFHLTNLLFHAASVILLFLTLQRMTGDLWRSAGVAALFGIHPLRVESVAWLTERKDVISILFLILTVNAYHRYTQSPSLGRYGVAVLCYLLGVMAKPVVVTLPFALLLLDYWPLYRLRLGQEIPPPFSARPGIRWWALVGEKLPFFAIALSISHDAYYYTSGLGGVDDDITWGTKVAIALSGYLGYLQHTLWPVYLAVLYHDREPAAVRLVIAVIVLVVVSAGLLWLARRKPALIVGWFWFLGTLVPNIGLVQAGPQVMADRFSYTAHIGLMILIVWGISDLLVWRQLSAALRGVLIGMVVLVLSTLTWFQVWHWQNTATLFGHALDAVGDHGISHFALGSHWLRHGEFERAEFHLAKIVQRHTDAERRRAVKLLHNQLPGNLRLEANRLYGEALLRRDMPEDACVYLEVVLELTPEDADAQHLMGTALIRLGRWDKALVHLQKSVRQFGAGPVGDAYPGYGKTRQAMPHLRLGEISLRDGHPETALEHLTRALDISPTVAEAKRYKTSVLALSEIYQLKGTALARLGRWSEAEQALLRSIELNPDNTASQGYLAFTYARVERKDRADLAYAELLARAPGWSQKTSDLSLKLVTRARFLDRTLAAELARQVCEATDFKDARWLNTLAAVQAAAGDFGSARATCVKAVDLTADPILRGQLKTRLTLYEKNQALPATDD